MSSSSHYPVVIIGSGPVGLTLANLLGVYRTGCLIIERNAATVQEPRAVSIDDESLRTLQNAGVVEDVLRHVVAGYGSIYYGPDRRPFATVEPTGRPYGYPRRNAFRQPILEQQLRDALGRFAHVQTRFGWEMLGFRQDEAGVALEAAGPDGAVHALTCDYLVGCDGASSRVREGLGLQLEGTTFDERWLILDLENNRNSIAHTEVHCDPRRPCITLPGPENTRRYEFKLLPGETDADLLDPAMVARLLATHGADDQAILRRKVVYRFHARSAPSWSAGRVFLAGDAAHLTPPFAGQGMNSGLRDAQNLAWKLAAVLAGRLGAGVLGTYEQERKDHLWQMIHLALRMGRVMAPKTDLHGMATRLFFRALHVWPRARDYVTQMKYKPAPFFAEGFLIGAKPGGLVGRLLPQPEMRTGDGRSVLLDHVLGPGFALLVRAADPAAAFAQMRHPVWDRLGVQRVALVPAAALGGTSRAGMVAVSAGTGVIEEALTAQRAIGVLLRPDRYVAAILPADPDGMARAIEALIAATWPNGDRGAIHARGSAPSASERCVA